MKAFMFVLGAFLLVVGAGAQPCRGPDCPDGVDVFTFPWTIGFGVGTQTCYFQAEVTAYECRSSQTGDYYFRRICWIAMPSCGNSSQCVVSSILEELVAAFRISLFGADPYNWFSVYGTVRVIHPSCWRVEGTCFVACTEGDPCCYIEGPRGMPGARQNTVVPVQCDPDCQNVCP